MKAKVFLELTLEELVEIQQSYLKIGEKFPGIEALKDNFIDNFLANKNDFIDPEEIKIYFV